MSRMTKKRISQTLILVLCVAFVSFSCGMYFQKSEAQRTSETGGQMNLQKNPAILFFGDSYSFGVGATSEDERWTTQLAAEMGTTEINAAIPGEGYQRRAASCEAKTCPYFLESLQNFTTVNANIVVLSGGHNDLRKMRYEPETVERAVEKTLNYLGNSYSESQIYVVGPTTPQAFYKEATALDNILSNHSESNHLKYISLSPIWTSLWGNMIDDKQHVNNAGHDIISNYIYEFIEDKNG